MEIPMADKYREPSAEPRRLESDDLAAAGRRTLHLLAGDEPVLDLRKLDKRDFLRLSGQLLVDLDRRVGGLAPGCCTQGCCDESLLDSLVLEP